MKSYMGCVEHLGGIYILVYLELVKTLTKLTILSFEYELNYHGELKARICITACAVAQAVV